MSAQKSDFPLVAVVILNYNGRNYLEKFIPPLLASTYENLKVIVGDNCSTDDSIDFLKRNFPDIEILSNDKNYGFAEGYNQILHRVTADYYVLLNSDVEVSPDWVEPIINLMEKDSEIGACQPKIRAYKEKEKFEYAGAAGGFIDKFGYPFCRGRIFNTLETDHGQYDENIETFWASGAALFVRASLYHKVGGLDGDFFAHMEEIDLCWRIKNQGYKIMCCPQSLVYHVGGGTLDAINPKKTFLNFRNSLLMLQKNLPFFSAIYILTIRFWLDLIAWIKFAAEGQIGHSWAISKAHIDFFWRQKKWIRKRLTARKGVTKKHFDHHGWYQSSILIDYYIRKKKKYSDIRITQVEQN